MSGLRGAHGFVFGSPFADEQALVAPTTASDGSYYQELYPLHASPETEYRAHGSPDVSFPR